MGDAALEIVRLWFPLLVAIAIALLVVLFRQVTWVVAPLAYVGACEVITLGAAGALGFTLNLVVSILPPLLFVIPLATALNLATRARALPVDIRSEPPFAIRRSGTRILLVSSAAAPVGGDDLALEIDGQPVGGIGVSGVKASDEEIVAQAGLDALRQALA